MQRRFFVLLVLTVINLVEQAALAQDYLVTQGTQVKVNISAKGVNRIAIENDRIAQVIGNEDEYFVESDPNLGQVFLTAAIKDSSEITIRFLTEREKIIDAKLIVSQVDPQNIIFKYKGEEGTKLLNHQATENYKTSTIITSPRNSYEYQANAANNNIQYIIDLIKLTYSNAKGTEIPTLSCLNNQANLKELKLIRAYSYELKYNVVKAVIQNKSQNIISLREQDFIGCMRDIKAIALDKDTLGPKESSNLYLIGSYGR